MRWFWTTCAVIAAFALAVTTANANVTLKNGNYYVGYTDVAFSGGLEMKIERVYNSKSPFNGMFGWGWGYDYAVRGDVIGDGTILVVEFGGGSENVFARDGHPTTAERDSLVAQILTAKKLSARDEVAERERLTNDASLARQAWIELSEKKLVRAPELPAGETFRASRFGSQTIVRKDTGFVRTFDNGTTEQFDDRGRLVRRADKNGNFIALAYRGDHLESTTDSANHKLTFKMTPAGKVESISTSDQRRASYKYDARGDLVETRDVDGNVFRHTYDVRHNLLSSTTVNGRKPLTREVGYYTRARHENVRYVRELDGTVTVYSYAGDGLQYSVGTEVMDENSRPISSSSYEYSIVRTTRGDVTARLVTTLDGDRTDTTYDTDCELPLRISHGGYETVFRYDPKCHVTFKDTPSDVTVLAYDPQAQKVSRVEKHSKEAPEKKTWSTFEYDAKGNLLKAENESGKKVKLDYDAAGRITVLTDVASTKVVRFKYNANSKPIEIALDGVGVLTVTYLPNGEIKKVDSSASGREVSLAVTSAFQELQDLIRPAGVSLSF